MLVHGLLSGRLSELKAVGIEAKFVSVITLQVETGLEVVERIKGQTRTGKGWHYQQWHPNGGPKKEGEEQS